MKIPETLIRVSKEQILKKTFDVTEEQLRGRLSGQELEAALALLPTDEEKQWMDIFNSEAPQLARIRRKMSVCIDAEITDLSEDAISWEYGGSKYRVESPNNAFRVCSALQRSALDAVAEMCRQKCVKMNARPVDITKPGVMPVDDMQLLVLIVSKFFFQIF